MALGVAQQEALNTRWRCVAYILQALTRCAGLTASQTEEVETSLMAMPTVHMAAKCVVDGEDSEDIMESDIVTCAARVVLTRHSHLAPGDLFHKRPLKMQCCCLKTVMGCFQQPP